MPAAALFIVHYNSPAELPKPDNSTTMRHGLLAHLQPSKAREALEYVCRQAREKVVHHVPFLPVSTERGKRGRSDVSRKNSF